MNTALLAVLIVCLCLPFLGTLAIAVVFWGEMRRRSRNFEKHHKEVQERIKGRIL